MGFIQNNWYMIAWADEVGTAPFSRTALDVPILIYRDAENGNPVALMDRCPHRFAPLSMGTVQAGHIRCGYHGLEFDKAGRCVKSPFTKTPPAAAKVRAFPLVEQDDVLWIWMGDPALADPSTIVRLPHHVDPDWRCVRGLTTAQADYRLLSDNLMDLTHIAFLHPAFGGHSYAPKVTVTEEADGSILADYLIDKMPNFLSREEMPCDHVRTNDRIRWVAPSTHLLEGRAFGHDDPSLMWTNPSAHILTPATASTTHYFWSSAVRQNSPLTDEMHMALLSQTFDNEDKPMVEAVQRQMKGAELFDLDPVLLKNDAAAVRVRRKTEALLAAEA